MLCISWPRYHCNGDREVCVRLSVSVEYGLEGSVRLTVCLLGETWLRRDSARADRSRSLHKNIFDQSGLSSQSTSHRINLALNIS